MLTIEGLRRRRGEILGIARRRRARRVAVFGSVARRDAHPGSDVDLLVDFEPGASLREAVIDYEQVWITMRDDVPRPDKAIKRWRDTQPEQTPTRIPGGS